jgi:hypothetical protein
MDKLGYTWYPKDFISDPEVMMMTASERGIYRDLIDLAYMSDNKIKYSLIQLAKYCNATENEIQNVLNLKAKKDGLMYSIPSCNKRLSKRNASKENGAKGGRPKKPNNNLNDNLNKTQHDTQREIEIEIENKKEIKKEIENTNKKFNFRSKLLEYGFKENLIDEWLLVRKNKKATNTETAFNIFINEIEKINLADINEILQLCVEKSWMGFKAEWYKNLKGLTNGTQSRQTQQQHPLANINAAATAIVSKFTSTDNS